MRATPHRLVSRLRALIFRAKRSGLGASWPLIDAILARGDLADYHLAHAARADLC
jgi:RNA polymerase sigma-70 factor, ECF subfamily